MRTNNVKQFTGKQINYIERNLEDKIVYIQFNDGSFVYFHDLGTWNDGKEEVKEKYFVCEKGTNNYVFNKNGYMSEEKAKEAIARNLSFEELKEVPEKYEIKTKKVKVITSTEYKTYVEEEVKDI